MRIDECDGLGKYIFMHTDISSQSPAIQTKFKRIVLKISGEALGSGQSCEPIDMGILENVCQAIKSVHSLGVQVGLVVGGGNIFRGLAGAQKSGTAQTAQQAITWGCWRLLSTVWLLWIH